MIEPPSLKRGRAFCTVKNSPFTWTSKVWSKWASVANASDCPGARVCEENVDVTMFLFHNRVEPVQIFQARHVAHHRRNVCFDRGCGLFQLFLSSPCDHDGGAFVHEAFGCGQANSAASAGDDCDLTLQFFHDFCPSFCVVFVFKFEKHGIVPGSEL